MKYYTIPPPLELSSYIRYFWILEGNASVDQPYVHRSMADGCCEMIFHYQGKFDELHTDGQVTSSILSGLGGPSRNVTRFKISKDFAIFGAYLYPFAMSSLLGLPASAITNQLPDMASVLGQPGADLEERIMLAKDNPGRVAILSKFLTSISIKGRTVHPAIIASVNHIIKTKGAVPVNTLSSQFFLSTRQFERHFKEQAGFSPKLYSRIIRFQEATSQYADKTKSLTDIAYDCGYYDQSHFIHDFKEFSGYHPRVYFSGRNEGTAWKER